MNMTLDNFTREKSLTAQMHSCLNPDLNIYNQAQLEMREPLINVPDLQRISNNEYGVKFQLQGELKGNIFCLVDLHQTNKTPEQNNHFESLFKEGMNILLGQFLTKLEDETGIMSIITAPTELKSTDNMMDLKSHIKLKTEYDLLVEENTYNCKIYIFANRKNISEV